MRRLLAALAVVLAAVAVGVGINIALDRKPPRPSVQSAPSTAPNDTAVDIVPGPGQSLVTGTLTSMSADNAVGPPIRPPFTITIPVRGQGNADITGVTVAGKTAGIFWYGGQPLPVSGTGQLALDGAPFSVDAKGITWTLDGAPRTLSAGHFSLGAPVAVGSGRPGGLADPHDSIAFDAGTSGLLATTGNAMVHLAPMGIHLTGPGRRVVLNGNFQVRSASASRSAHAITFGPGSYSIDLTPLPGGDTVTATLQGPATLA